MTINPFDFSNTIKKTTENLMRHNCKNPNMRSTSARFVLSETP